MTNLYRRLAIVIACLMLLCLVSCKNGELPPKDEADTSIVNRGTLVESVTLTSQETATVDSLKNYIDMYNQKVDDSLKIKNHQIITDNDAYIITGDNGIKYTARIDKNGDVMTFFPSSGTSEQRVTASSAIMEMMWGRKYIPDDVQAYIDHINGDISSLLVTIAEERASMAENNLDTSLPKYADLTEKAKEIQKDFDKYKSEILKNN